MNRIPDSGHALAALLQLMLLPAILMLVAGVLVWYKGYQAEQESRIRIGKMLTMFGSILLTILLITAAFLSTLLQRGQAT